MFHAAHVIAASFRGFPLAIRMRFPPVPSRRHDARLYHVACPVKERLGAGVGCVQVPEGTADLLGIADVEQGAADGRETGGAGRKYD
jgi:hypothetical protein